jgi:hypothetical protein
MVSVPPRVVLAFRVAVVTVGVPAAVTVTVGYGLCNAAPSGITVTNNGTIDTTGTPGLKATLEGLGIGGTILP